MEYDTRHSRDLAPAFDVIREYDPGTYARMVAADWFVTSDAWDMPEAAAHALDNQAGGVTVFNDEGRPGTLIVRPVLDMVAEAYRQPAKWVTASTLVHEFAHTTQDVSEGDSPEIETPAFAAQRAFTALLPERLSAPLMRLLAASEPYEAAVLTGNA